MRFLSAVLLLATAASAQSIPSDTLTTKLWERDTPRKKFLREHPGATEIRRLPDAIHFKMPEPDTPPDPLHYAGANGPAYTAIFGKGLAYVDAVSGEIVPTEQAVWQIDSGGYRTVGGPVTVRIIDGARGSSVIEAYGPTGRSFKLNPSRTTYIGENKFTLDWEGLTWTVELGALGWSMASSPITTARGAYTYQAPYIQSLVALSADAATGDLVGDGDERLTRAVMVGADGISRSCSAWSLTTKVMSFVCDDSVLPTEAFPYRIDPTYSAVPAGTVRNDCWFLMVSGYGATPAVLGCDQSYLGSADSVWALGFNYWYRYDDASFFRWDTSSIPSTATVTSGTLKLMPGQQAYSGTMAVQVYWWDYTNAWPPVAADRPENASRQWQAGSLGPTGTAWATFEWASIPLSSNINRVNKGPGAYTAIKMGGGNLYYGTSTMLDFYGPWGYGTRHWNAPILELTYSNAPANVSASPAGGSISAGVWTAFTSVYRDSDGVADLRELRLLLAYGVDGVNACHPMYRKTSNEFLLLNDPGNSWGTGYAPGAVAVLSNSQCDFDVQNSSVSCSGTDCTVNWRLRFKPTFTYGGYAKHMYTHAYDMAYGESGWSDWGSWNLVVGGPKLIVVSE